MTLERELRPDVLEIKEVVDLIKYVGLETTVTNLGNYYEKLVKEFLLNIPDECDDPMSSDYHHYKKTALERPLEADSKYRKADARII
jgi:hypothetical protein